MNLFLVKWCLQQGSGNNLCGYYVCEFLMEYSRRTSEEILEVRKKYTQFIYYHCVDIYNHIYIYPYFSFHLNLRFNGGSKSSCDVNRTKQFKRHCQDFLWMRS
jgi:hypothetical protein